MSAIVVSVPARAEHVAVLRTVVATTAAGLSFTIDDIQDLRLAIDEACALLLSAPGASTITVRTSADDGSLSVLASTDGRTDAWPPAEPEKHLTWQVLSALADDAAFDSSNGGPAVRFSKRPG
jgi:serine/threonine-protein kinase RsbW